MSVCVRLEKQRELINHLSSLQLISDSDKDKSKLGKSYTLNAAVLTSTTQLHCLTKKSKNYSSGNIKETYNKIHASGSLSKLVCRGRNTYNFLVDTKKKKKLRTNLFLFFLSTLSSVGHSSLPMQHSSCIPKQMTACVRPLSCLLRVTFFWVFSHSAQNKLCVVEIRERRLYRAWQVNQF